MVLAVTAAPAAAATCSAADTAIGALNLGAARDAVLCLVNNERTARGLSPLERDGLLETAAQLHSEDMVLRGFFSHDNPDGLTPGGRITAAGYAWAAYGENIAAGYRTPRAAMEGWMASEGHCENVLGTTFTELGVGISIGAALVGAAGTWTQNFGRPTGVQAPSNPSAPADGCPYDDLVTDAGGDGEAPPSGTAPPGSSPGVPGLPGTGLPGDPIPGEGAVPGTGGATVAKLTLVVRRTGRRLRVAGLAIGAGEPVTIRVRAARRTLARRKAVVSTGRYRLNLRLPAGAGRVKVVAVCGGKRVVRRIG